MRHKGTVQLETERCQLRKFDKDDMLDFYHNCLIDDLVWKWTSYETISTIEDVREKEGLFTNSWFHLNEQVTRYNWAIVLKTSGEVIGRVQGMNVNEEKAELELAYEIGSAHWNQGLMTEVLKVTVTFLPDEVDLRKIYAYHAMENPASGKVMLKAGMVSDKMIPDGYTCNAGTFDAHFYSISKNLKESYHGR
jgi:ribosomal-protein-alanine N-acetyltransferase